jgi:hypothetical protein
MKNTFPSPCRCLRRIVSVISFIVIFAYAGNSRCVAGEFHNSLSLQGFTGLLNTPNAEVTEEGTLYFLFSNQKESQWRNSITRQENYMFSVGLFSFAELGGRLTNAPGKVRDLSGNFKVKVPFIPKGYYLPSIAFGMQDFGGASSPLETIYVVASEELWRFRLSLGYGFGPDRMHGVFGGVEFKAFDWLYLVGENDTRETNAGIRLISPAIFGVPIHLNVTAKTSLSHRPGEVIDFGFGLQIPLGLDHHNAKPVEEKARITHRAPEEKYGMTAKKELVAGQAPEGVAEPEQEEGDRDAVMLLLKKALIDDGFLNVEVGSAKNLLVVQYENGRYNHNELDGLGVVAGIASAYAPPGIETIRFIIRKKGIRVLQLTTPAKVLREFLLNADELPRFDKSLRITSDVKGDGEVRYVKGNDNPSWLRSSVVVYPGLTTFYGTEVGVFDYLLSVKPTCILDLWKGAALDVRGDVPVVWSENFDDGKYFRNVRQDPRLERAMIFQAVRIFPTVMASIGAGMILKDTYGTLNELMWVPGNGDHRFRVKAGYSEHRNHDSGDEVALGSYRYYFAPLATYAEVTGGKFWDQDTGFTVELKRFFGDTAFSVYYKDIRTVDNQHVQMGGVQFSFPLTPRRDMKPYIVQLRGTEEWNYAVETEIVEDRPNLVGRSVGINPQPEFNLERLFYNRDRFMEAYLRKHLLRLRDANIRYNKNRFP